MNAGRQRLIVVGNGMAAVRALEHLMRRAFDAYDVTVFGAEPHHTYNRIALSPLLSGEKKLDEVITHPASWYAGHEIQLCLNEPVIAIDREARTVTTSRGRTVGYDRLLLATGSRPFVPAIPGISLPGVVAFRGLRHVQAMLDAARAHRNAVVIGGGVLGLEAASALARQGMQVSLLHRGGWLMDRQLDAEAGAMLQTQLERRGIRFFLKANTAEIEGTGRCEALRLTDGTRIEADLVVVSTGIVPEIRLAQQAGLACGKGIVVDDRLTTSDPNILAIGECIEHRGLCYGLVAPAYEQAEVAAAQLVDADHASRYAGSVTSLKLKVTGIDLFSAGDFSDRDGAEVLLLRDTKRDLYRRLVLREGRLSGVVLVGDTRDSSWYFDLLQSGEAVGAMRDLLVFGPAWAEAA